MYIGSTDQTKPHALPLHTSSGASLAPQQLNPIHHQRVSYYNNKAKRATHFLLLELLRIPPNGGSTVEKENARPPVSRLTTDAGQKG